MYTKQEASQLRQEFWTTFGRYMAPVLSAEGTPVNWINYKTGETNISFKMDADNNVAIIGIMLSHPDEGIRQLYFQQFEELKKMFVAKAGEGWIFAGNKTDQYGKVSSMIYKQLDDVNVFDKQDWPRLISFFKQHIILLDSFWAMAKYAFESLR